jgi:hypothetical protein
MPVATSTMFDHTTSSSPSSPLSLLKSTVNSVEINSDTPNKQANVKQDRALEKIYNRAARAFLNRNVTLTHELLETGFKSLQTVPFNASISRKWDILRITFDTMLYTSPPTPSIGIPSLNDMLSKTPQGFVDDMYNRSLELFREPEGNASLPSHVLSALVYSSLKTDAPDVGRRMVEDWLAGRADSENLSSSWMSSSSSSSTQDGYDAEARQEGLRTV